MEYDLNSSDYNSIIYKEEILKKIDEYGILRYYFPGLRFYKVGFSPFREDSIPSFSITDKYGFIYWKDFGTGEGGNIWTLVARKFGVSYTEALAIIASDFGVRTSNNALSKVAINNLKATIPERRPPVEIGVKTRLWTKEDKVFWSQFGISKAVLERYNISPVTHVFFNDYLVKPDKLAYVYREYKDGVVSFKIYQPYSKKYKWMSNSNSSVWEGWEQLPDKGDTLIITSSRKDVMSIYCATGLPAISLQAETTSPKPHVMQQLKDRFTNVYVLYDNDYTKPENPGRTLGKQLSDSFGLIQIEIPDEFQSKDFSDLVKNHGKEKSKILLNSLL